MIDDPTNPVDDQWSTFERGFDAAHRKFLAQLAEISPSLHPTEIRICSMILLGLNTHEIATMLHLSERSVESCRHSIRQKLEIGKGEDMRSFLESIYLRT